MVIARPTTEHEVQETLVQFLRGIGFARRLWIGVDRDILTFWVLTAPVRPEVERDVYRVNMRIYERVPEARFNLIVVNPALFDDHDFHFDPPAGAREIPLL